MSDPLPDLKKSLEKRKADLYEEYEAANAQLSRALDDSDQPRLQRRINDLVRKIRQIEGELSRLNLVPTTPEVLPEEPVNMSSNAFTDIPKSTRKLRVFLCHASGDKPKVREIYQRLRTEGVDPWLDEEKLLPGQVWPQEIPKAVRSSDIVIVCLSQRAVTKSGYVQKEIKYALDVADEQPEGSIFLIPVKLEECEVPQRLSRWQWVNLFEERGWVRLMLAIRKRAEEIGVTVAPSSHLREVTAAYLEKRFSYFLQVVLGLAVGGLASIVGNGVVESTGIIISGLAILVLTAVVLIEPRFKNWRVFVVSSMAGCVVVGLTLASGFTLLPGEMPDMPISP